MKSPIEVYKEVVKEFSVADGETVSPVGMMTYVQEQAGQQRAIINRLLWDIVTTKVAQAEAKDAKTIDAYRKKIDDYRGDLMQLLDAVRVNVRLIDELRAEYEELAIKE